MVKLKQGIQLDHRYHYYYYSIYNKKRAVDKTENDETLMTTGKEIKNLLMAQFKMVQSTYKSIFTTPLNPPLFWRYLKNMPYQKIWFNLFPGVSRIAKGGAVQILKGIPTDVFEICDKIVNIRPTMADRDIMNSWSLMGVFKFQCSKVAENRRKDIEYVEKN